jgi:acetoin utilization protein AcuB
MISRDFMLGARWLTYCFLEARCIETFNSFNWEIPMKQMPKIDKVMTPMPHTIGKEQSMRTAMELMRNHQIRHLPVLHEGKLIGVLTDRDIKLASSFQNSGDLTVEDVMTPDPYSVTPDTPLDRVSETMAQHKYGCAIVAQENGKVVGIFTANDGLLYLKDVMREHYKQAG